MPAMLLFIHFFSTIDKLQYNFNTIQKLTLPLSIIYSFDDPDDQVDLLDKLEKKTQQN